MSQYNTSEQQKAILKAYMQYRVVQNLPTTNMISNLKKTVIVTQHSCTLSEWMEDRDM